MSEKAESEKCPEAQWNCVEDSFGSLTHYGGISVFCSRI
jgi:hypothetical protein